MNTTALLLILISVIAANLPFLTERVLFLIPLRSGNKHFAIRLLEWLLLYFAVGWAATLLERKLGSIHPQGWEFYVITLSLFLVFAYPGFVYRYLWRSRKK